MVQYLAFCGYTSSNVDASLFVKKTSKTIVLVLLYMDYMIIIRDNEQEVSKLKEMLEVQFKMKNIGTKALPWFKYLKK